MKRPIESVPGAGARSGNANGVELSEPSINAQVDVDLEEGSLLRPSSAESGLSVDVQEGSSTGRRGSTGMREGAGEVQEANLLSPTSPGFH